MCGITGFVGHRPRGDARSTIACMTGTLAHRGPDDQGVHVDGPVALGVGPAVLAWWAVLGRIGGLYQHANIDFALGPFAWLFSIGELHRWHHARGFDAAKCNYGNTFILWDALLK